MSSNANSTKCVNVSYSLNKIRKSIYVPQINQEFKFGSNMTDPVWKDAARIEDFAPFAPADKKEFSQSTLLLFRTNSFLVLGWFFAIPETDRLYPAETANPSPWHGDLAELHFGSTGPDPSLLQLAVGITGLTFDSSGSNLWQAHTFENADGWGAEIRIPASCLLITEGGIGFNFCRCDMKKGEFQCWSPLRKRFHEVENFGELLFDSYNNIALLRSGISPAAELNRNTFEKLRNSWETPAQKVIHGPYLSAPDQTSVCISWETAGRVPAFLEYKIKDSDDAPNRIYCSRAHGILASETLHFAQLANLKPDTTYQYQIFTLTPVIDTPASAGNPRFFKTAPRQEQDFSFFCVTDLHSNANYLTYALNTPQAQQSAFHLLLGDNLSHAAGREALFGGIIDPIVAVNQQKDSDTPLVFVRGNHEQLGVFACEYFSVMRHPSGYTRYAFSYGKAFFIVLDSGDDKADGPARPLFSNNQLLAEEKEFLTQVVQTEEYRNADYRIAFIHIPPLTKADVQYDLVQPLVQAETPLTVMLSGHWHDYVRVDKNTQEFSQNTAPRVAAKLQKAAPLPFARIVLSTDNALFCKVTEKALELEILSVDPEKAVSTADKIVFSR